ncbi:MAG: nicotinate phosphoribosyltransferase [Planctomycetes bacterium]|nr:nicotinate phosphoribosyltransferase [Planctomycetota bacterium]
MNTLPHLYRHSLALLTDLYQLTMANAYWKEGLAEREAAFHLIFRRCPFGGEYAIACGLSYAADFIENFRFDEGDVAYLASLCGVGNRPLFEPAFLDYLRDFRIRCEIDAVPEGTAVFAHEPLVRVVGPLLECQLLETPLLNMINFQTLIATKAARVCRAAEGEPVLEFGLRRSQGIDGGVSASRAAYIGGCAATSNVLAGKLFDIPVKGTHAHSWVMAFDEEQEAFDTYARAMPHNSLFLVDTYDTLSGVRRAVQAGRLLREAGHEMLGIRLDSGDLAALSIEARKILDEGGFPDASIVASGDLDEYEILEAKRRGARIDTWGVGTRLATAWEQPALGGVYKLAAIKQDSQWRHRVKLSDSPIKVSDPGILQVRRYANRGRFVGDAIYDEAMGISEQPTLAALTGDQKIKLPAADSQEDLLAPIFRDGERNYETPSAKAARERTSQQLAALDESVTRLADPQPYVVGLEQDLHDLKAKLMREAREKA